MSLYSNDLNFSDKEFPDFSEHRTEYLNPDGSKHSVQVDIRVNLAPGSLLADNRRVEAALRYAESLFGEGDLAERLWVQVYLPNEVFFNISNESDGLCVYSYADVFGAEDGFVGFLRGGKIEAPEATEATEAH